MENISQKDRDSCNVLLKMFQVEGEIADKIITEGQLEIFYNLVARKYNRVHIETLTQYGKQIADDTPVLTIKGWRTHGKLKIGDYVFNENGKPVKIIALSPKGIDDIEIEFSNKEKIICHENHEWKVYDSNNKKYSIIEAKDILKRGVKISGQYNFKLPNKKPVLLNSKKLPIDPYTLGAWLGDGTSSKPSITIDPKDSDILKRIPYKVSSFYIHKDTCIGRYRFFKTNLFNDLRKLDLINNKHIPDIYKFSSVKQRLELLAGLIDTDGSVNKETRERGWKNGRIYIINTNKRLIDDVQDILYSLGLNKCSVVKVKATESSSGIIGKKDVYYLGFVPFIDIPTVLKRKKIIQKEQQRISIKNIKRVKGVSGNCIQVDSKDGIYLVGRKLIPTHNSLIVALGALVITCIQGEVVSIVAPTDEKAKIIMRYYIEHLGDHPMLYSQLAQDTKLDRLRQEMSQSRIILRNGGGIFVVSANATNTRRTIESAMGLGSRIVLMDEACLIPDNTEAIIFRMIAGKGADAFYCVIGNPFYRNPPYTHFYKSYRDPNYHTIKVDYHQALREGRVQPQFIEEAKKKPHFDILFECNFPAVDSIDARGYSPLIVEDELDKAYENKLQFFGENRLGIDVAGGGKNYSVIVLRSDNGAKVLYKERLSDTMTLVGIILRFAEEYDVANNNISVDTIGVGKGVYDRLCEQLDGIGSPRVNGVNVGESAQNSENFINLRAQAFWRVSRWIKEGGKLERDANWEELLNIKYKVQSDKKVKVIGKDEMLKDGIVSPDVADGLMLTFINIGQPRGYTPQYKPDWSNEN